MNWTEYKYGDMKMCDTWVELQMFCLPDIQGIHEELEIGEYEWII